MRCIHRSRAVGLVVARGNFALPRYTLFFIFSFLLIFSLTGCSLDKNSDAQSALPPGAALAIPENAPPPAPTPMDTFRALAPPEGLKFTPLFERPLDGADEEIKRLQGAVQSVRNDFDTVVPTLVRLAAIEKDIKGLVAQLQTLTDQGQMPSAPVADANAPTPLTPPQNGGDQIPGEELAKGTEPAHAADTAANAGPVALSSPVTPEAVPKGELPPEGAASPSSPPPAATQKSSAAGSAVDIRVADYPDKTRVVIDISVKTQLTARMEDDNKTLVIPLASLNWLGKESGTLPSAKLVSSYRTGEGNLYVDLKRGARIVKQAILDPAPGNKNYRLMIDLEGEARGN